MEHPSRRLDLVATAIMIVLCVSWGFNHPLMKWVYRDISPVLSAALRSALAWLALVIYARLRGVRLSAPDVHWRHGAILAGFFIGEFLFLYIGLDLTLASRGVVLLYIQPVFTALGAHLFVPGDRLNTRRTVGLALAFAGVAWVLTARPDTGQAGLTGDIFCLIAGAMWAGINVYTRAQLVGRVDFHTGLFWQLSYSTPVLFIASLVLEEPRLTLTWGLTGGMLYQAVVIAFASYLIFFKLLYRHAASDLAAFTFLTPVFGVMFSGLIMGDVMTVHLIGSLVLVSAGVWLVNRN